MKLTVIGAALATFLFAAPSWAQSLTPIRGWVPFPDNAAASAKNATAPTAAGDKTGTPTDAH